MLVQTPENRRIVGILRIPVFRFTSRSLLLAIGAITFFDFADLCAIFRRLHHCFNP